MPSLENKHKVIINADDFGITEGVNKAIFKLVEVGTLTSTTVMSNMPCYKDIVKLRNKIGIGIHFNLTTGKPVTDPKKITSLVNEVGEFLKLSKLLERMRQGQISKQEVEIELDAQIKRLIDLGIEIDHLDSHESILKYPFFMRIMKKLAKTYGIMAVRTYTPRKFDYTRLLKPKRIMISVCLAYQKFGWKRDGFLVTDKYDSLIKIDLDHHTALKKLEDIFHNLPEGILEVGTHPGYSSNSDEFLGEYVNEREVELQILKSNELKEIINKSKAELITFRDMISSKE